MTGTRARGMGLLLTVFAAAIAALAFAGSALASEDEGGGSSAPAPTIASDKADYRPGELVTLTGANWAPGEEVVVNVNDDQGQTWYRSVTVVADGEGRIVDQFNLPDWFVALYTVVATGNSGTATTTFTDGNVKVAGFFGGDTDDTFTLTFTRYADAGCTGTASNQDPQDRFVGVGDTTPPPGNNDSIQLTASLASAEGRTFVKWVDGDGNDVVVGATFPRTVCADFPPGADKTWRAHYAGNAAPTANAQSVSTDEDTALTITLSGSDPDGNNLTFSIVSGPSNGTLGSIGTVTCSGTPSACSADVTYTPNANYNGPDSFTFKVNDGTVDSNTATVSITVNAVDDAPVAAGDTATVDEDDPPTTIDVLANDTDIDGGPKFVDSVTQPANGTVVITNDGADLTYQPDADYCNDGDPTDDFTYTLNGGSTATVAATVTCVNDAPVAADDSYSTDEDTPLSEAAPGVLGNDSDVDGDSLTAVLVDDVDHGTLTLNADGSFDYTPAANYNGADSFTYTANDGDLDSNTATVTLTINPVNDAPTVAADNASVTVDEGSTAANTGTFDDADLDDSSPDTVTITASVGTVTQDDSARTWSWSFGTSDGPDDSQQVTITATDEAGQSSQTTFDLTVRNVHPTVDLVGPASADEGETESYTYTFTDPGADSWTQAVSCGGSGSVSDDEFDEGAKSGSFKCTWDDNHASQIVSAKVDDDDGGTDTDTIDVEIANVAPTATLANDGPVDEGSAATISFSDQSDPSSADTTAGFRYAYRCDGNAGLLPTTYAAATTSDSATCVFGDNGSHTVKARIFDKDNGHTTYETTVEVDNVAPTASNPFFELNPVTGTATAKFDYRDAGWLDTHTDSYFTWSIDGGADRPPTALTRTEFPWPAFDPPYVTGTAADTRTLTPGCYNLTVTGTAKDDDGDSSAPLTIFSGSTTAVLAKAFRPPIMDNERNIAKYGNVVPVKFTLTTTCTGATVTTETLHIQVVKGIVLEGDPDPIEGDNPVTESVSNADSGTQMRVADGQYIYNLSTKGYTANTNYTIRIRLGSSTGPIIARAFLYPKK